MLFQGVDYLKDCINQGNFTAKMVFNENGAIIFPVQAQHKDMKVAGVSYEDNYRGNALAAMLMPSLIEVRFHKDFSDIRVGRIIKEMASHKELHSIVEWGLTYQGRRLKL